MKTDDKYLAMKVNSFLIQTIYRNLGNNRSITFRNTSVDYIPGKKISYQRVYTILGIEKSKFNRILNEDKNTGYTKEETEKISLLFNLDKVYFQKEKAVLFPIAGFDIEDWKILFNESKGYNYETKKRMMERDKKNEYIRLNNSLEKSIKEICQNGVANIGDADNPLYRIAFFFIHGRTYNNDQFIDGLNELINKLDEIKINDWNALRKSNNLKKAYEVLTKQFEIVDAIMKIEKYKISE